MYLLEAFFFIGDEQVNGKVVDLNDTRVHQVTYERQILFDIPFSLRSDTGKYTVTLENDQGSTSASATVTVLDRPSVPLGPLTVSGVRKDCCFLTWKAPLDDGGAPVTHYVIEKMDTSRGTWAEAGVSSLTTAEVLKLTHMKEYYFRVKAVNSIGESEPLATASSIVAKNAFDEPDAPGRPEIADWDSTHVDLTWSPPKYDGGSPISGYLIQKKEKGSPFWQNAAQVTGGTCKGRARDLSEGTEYEFRVIAINAAGQSEPSEPSDLIMARPRHLAPKIKTPLRDIRVKAGTIFHVNIDFIGEPAPEVSWTCDGRALKTDERTTITAIGYHTIVHIVNTRRSDSGELVLQLTNDSGSDQGSFHLIVLDKPGPPTGPLEYEEITSSSVTLSWKPPKDNGGSDITAYVIEKRDLSHGGGWVPAVNYVDPRSTVATVPRLMEGTKYEFRVMAENLQGRSDPLNTDKPIVAKNQYDVPGRPGRPEALDTDKDHITIKWAPPYSNGGSQIVGYDVERRDMRSGGRWTKISPFTPVKRCEYTDDHVQEGHQYEYRVMAINAAGPSKPSDPSHPFFARPMREEPKLYLDGLLGRRVKVKAGEPINIEIPISGAPTPTVVWLRQEKKLVDTRFVTDTQSDRTKLYVSVSRRGDSDKYQITAQNAHGKAKAEVDVVVVDRPGPPTGPLNYVNVSADNITLVWKAPADDGGSDISGYIIEKTEVGSENWRPLPGYCPGTTFTVKSGLEEGRRYMFRVRAENMYGLSEPLDGMSVVAKSPFDTPDAPGQPKITSYTPSSCSLAWEPPANTGGRPISGYFVERRDRGGEWVRVNQFLTPNLNYNVTGLMEGNRYEFRVVAVNEAGPGKPSRATEPLVARIQRFPPDAPDAPKPDRVTKNSVALSWRAPHNDGGLRIKGYIVQKKAKNSEEWQDANSTLAPDTSYTVTGLVEGEEYQFRVIAENDAGQSPPSRASPNIKIEEQADRPHIDLGAVKDITLRAGEDFSIVVPFRAFPKPTASWFANDTIFDETDVRVHMQVADDYATIVVKDAKRSDTGSYKVQIRNCDGFDSVSCNVRVLDRPAPPQNLHADEFAGDSLTLVWSPPKDNGGGDITNYVVEKKECGRSKDWSRVSGYITTCTCRVRGLIVGRDYEFRVKAENLYGISDPCLTEQPIKAKHSFDPPGPPGTPRSLETSGDSITIAWSKPRNDGGSHITGYVVERRQFGEDKWVRASHSIVPDLTYRVINLTENHEYEFRVSAVNAAGQGPWSANSDLICCRPPPCAPKITSDLSIRDMTVIAGEEFTITVPFTASPTPKPTWTINNDEVMQDDRIRFETSTTATVYLNRSAKRNDSGKYTIRLTNSEGFDSASCKVLVVDRPTPPLSPLDVSDITPDSCTLSWRPPSDDGGSPITNYVVERMEVSMGIWTKISSFVRACSYNVFGLETNKKYLFRIRAENQYGVSDPLVSDDPITARFPFTIPDPPGQPRVTDAGSESANIWWDRPRSDGGSKIQGYQVERRDVQEDREWLIVNDYLIKDNTVVAHNLLTDHEYEFRVRAKNAAGFSKPSPSSSRYKTKGKFSVPSPPGVPQVAKVGRSYVDLKWTPPVSDGGSRVTGYIVEKRQVGGSLWSKCNDYNVIDCEYTVINLTEGLDYEFRVFAVNAAGKSEPSQGAAPVKVLELVGGEKPTFTRVLVNQGVPLGKKTVFECEATGLPVPKARWMKNGREVSAGGRFHMEDRAGVFRLTISELWELDEGDYTCEASNAIGSITCSARLRIGNPPRIDRMPGDLYLPEGDNTKIKIYFSGDHPMDAILTKDGQTIVETTRIKYTVFDEYLIIFIREVTKADAGNYTLTVKNDSGSVSASFTVYITGLPGAPIGPLEVSDVTQHMCTLNWKVPAYDGGKRITHYVVERHDTSHTHWIVVSSLCKETTFTVQGLTEGQEYLFRVMAVNENGIGPALEGVNPIRAKAPFDAPSAPGVPSVSEVGKDFAHLSWAKPDSDGGSRIQGYWIDKREAGSTMWMRINQSICITTQFNVSSLVEDRQYEFRVLAQNEAGLSPPSMASTLIRIKDPNASTIPEILSPLKNVLGLENRNAQFQCSIIGNPTPTITWYKGMRELFPGGKHSMRKEGDTYFLVISDIFGEDADEYVCRAVNKAGAKSTRADLIIKTAPKINVPPRFRDTAFFDKGENVVVKIPFTGNPRPKVVWSREGETIESGAHYHVEVQHRHAILTIRDVTRLDSGPYKLTVENELGMDCAILKLQISDRPEPPRMPTIEPISIGHDSLILSWKPPSWDGGSSITNYIVEKRELPMSSWIRVGHTRFCTMNVTALSAGHQYEFRIYAENVYGRSDASECTELIETKSSGKKQAKRRNYEVDETGKRIRNTLDEGKVKDYDQFVVDIYSKYVPQPVDIKTTSVYDYYDILEEIGTGAFGVVHRCRERKSGQIFAAKFIPVSHAMEKDLIRKEIDIMNQLHHPKLINLHDAFEDDDEMVLIYEFLSGGELFERITAEGYTMSEAEVINYMRQICEAVKHMHEKNIIHLDVKPENIMCMTKNSTIVKLIDFGLATKLDPNELVKISTGTAEFAAPEIVEREPVGFYTDMWAIGVLAYVLLSGLSPFAGENDIDTLKNVKACDWDFDEEAFASVSEEGKDFIRRLLTKAKEKRMTAHECLQHAWLLGDHTELTKEISSLRFVSMRDRIRARYAAWNEFLLPLGRLSEYSCLRKLQIERYRIHELSFDRREAAPRFVIRPRSAFAFEGQSAKFMCRIIAIAPPTVTWFHNNSELKQSVKFMKRYGGDDYTFVINRVKLEDRGEYIIRATNHWGSREEPIFLNVQRKSLSPLVTFAIV